MAPARPTLAASHRDVTGKKVAYLRRAGVLPGVVFGRGLESDSVSVDIHEFESLRRQAGANTLVDLSVDGRAAAPVLVHGVQLHRVTRKPLHVDLFVVRMTEELTVDVPLVSEGVSDAVETLGGTLLHVIEHVRVRALPDHLPQSIRYSIEPLSTFDDAIHVSDLPIPSDATLLTDGDEVVAKVLPPRVEEEPVVAEVEEGEEGEEGAAEGAEGAEDADGGEGRPAESRESRESDEG
jgi:large subunit ribosomal protein L25